MSLPSMTSASASEPAVGPRVPSANLGFERLWEISTSWQNVFDVAHRGTGTGQGSPGGDGAAHPVAQLPRRADRKAPATGWTNDAAVQPAQFGEVIPAREVATKSREALSGAAAVLRLQEEDTNAPDLLLASNVDVPAEPARIGDDTGLELPEVDPPDPWPSTTAEAEPCPGKDTVNVFVHEAAVTIVVRDSALSDEKALRSGLEAARQLAGHGGALRRLTLNGRTLYQNDLGSVAVDDTSRIGFAC
jgi:hypothetical protein